jgi:hypothetical protein
MILNTIPLPYKAGPIKLCRLLMIFAFFDDQLQSVILFVHQQLCRTSWVSLINLTALGAFLLRRAAGVLYISSFLLQHRRRKLLFFFFVEFRTLHALSAVVQTCPTLLNLVLHF